MFEIPIDRVYGVLLFLHILGATVWTGGHLVLSLAILPRAYKERSTLELLRFESAYEKIGIPALLMQVASGAWLAYQRIPDASRWLDIPDPASRLIALKLLLLAMTLMLALDARLRVIPRLSARTIASLAWHVAAVTVISILLVLVGVSFRTGWLS